MSSGDLQTVFAEIESLSRRFKLTLIQFDHEVQGTAENYHKGDWRKIAIKGRGGTSFVNLVNWLKENNRIGQVNIILTDGFAPWPERENFHLLWVLTNSEAQPAWGDVVRLRE